MRPQPTPAGKSHSSFGTVMSGRTWSAETSYRYGFNGKEGDDEFSVDEGSYDFGARMYDSRLGRFESPDPLTREIPMSSPYSFAGSSPIMFIDAFGKRKWPSIIISDERTGRTIKLDLPATKGLYSKEVRVDEVLFGFIETDDFHFEQAWYDYNEVFTITINKEGKITVSRDEIPIGKPRTLTYHDWEGYASFKVGDTADGWGGVNWTSESGMGEEEKQGRWDVQSEDIDALLSAVSGLFEAAGGKIEFPEAKDFQTGSKTTDMMWEALSKIRSTVESMVGTVDAGAEAIMGIKRELTNDAGASLESHFSRCTDCDHLFRNQTGEMMPKDSVKSMGMDTSKMRQVNMNTHPK